MMAVDVLGQCTIGGDGQLGRCRGGKGTLRGRERYSVTRTERQSSSSSLSEKHMSASLYASVFRRNGSTAL